MKKYGTFFALSFLLGVSVVGCASQRGQVSISEEYAESSLYSVGGAEIEGTVTAISVHTTESDVEFIPSKDGQIVVEDYAKGDGIIGGTTNTNVAKDSAPDTTPDSTLSEDHQLHYYLDGLTLRVEEYGSGVDVTDAPAKTIVIHVPIGTSYYEVSAESSSGNVSMSGIIIDQLNIETTGGDITLKDTTAKSLEAIATAGNIEVEGVLSSLIEAETTIGSISIDVDSQPFRLTTVSDSGAVNLKLSEKPGFTLMLNQEDGLFTDNYGLKEQAQKTGTADETAQAQDAGKTYVAGTGENQYSVTTKSGDVVLER